MLEQCLTLDAHLIEDWVMIMMNSAENFWPIFLWNRSQDVEGSCFVALCRSIIPSGHAYQKNSSNLGNEEKLKPTSVSIYPCVCIHSGLNNKLSHNFKDFIFSKRRFWNLWFKRMLQFKLFSSWKGIEKEDRYLGTTLFRTKGFAQ